MQLILCDLNIRIDPYDEHAHEIIDSIIYK